MAKDWGLKVTLDGKDITSTDPRDYALWSKFKAMMRIQSSGGGTAAIDSSGAGAVTTVTINHNLGYAPFFQVFIKWIDGVVNPEIENATYGSADPLIATVEFQPKVTANDLILRWFNGAPLLGASCEYYYFIGRDPAV